MQEHETSQAVHYYGNSLKLIIYGSAFPYLVSLHVLQQNQCVLSGSWVGIVEWKGAANKKKKKKT